MRALGVLGALLIAGCGDSGPQAAAEPANSVRPAQSAARSAPPEAPEPPLPASGGAPPQLEPMGSDEVEAAGLLGAGCDFTVGEQLLLVAVEREAIARAGGRIVRLSHYGPLGSTGGFFASRHLRISVGRIEGREQATGEAMSWPARIAVTSSTAGQPSRIEGRWSCGA